MRNSIQITDGDMMAVIPMAMLTNFHVSDTDIRVWAMLWARGFMDLREEMPDDAVADMIHVNREKFHESVSKLIDLGYIEESGGSK